MITRVKFLLLILVPMTLWGLFPIGVMTGDQAFIRKVLVVCAAIWIYVVCTMDLDRCPHCGAETGRLRGSGLMSSPGPTESCGNCGGDIEGADHFHF